MTAQSTRGTVVAVLCAFVGTLTINLGCPMNNTQSPPDVTSGSGDDPGNLPPDQTNNNNNNNATPGAPPTTDIDTDGDGFSDDEEINGTPGTDPNDPTDNPNNVRDSDGDGCSDFDETFFIGFCDRNPNTPGDAVPPPDANPDGTVTISGTVLVGQNLVVDGDTNDPTDAVIPNDDIATQQTLPNPCTLGGYLGVTRRGVDGSDVYRVQMAAGQTATLFLANPTQDDFDLFLHDETGAILERSEGTGKAELVTAPGNGTFLIEVFGFSVVQSGDPGGLYTLLIGDNTLGGAASVNRRTRLSSLHNFVDGEVIVLPKRPRAGAPRAKTTSRPGLEFISGGDDSGGFERLRLTDPSPAIAAKSNGDSSALGLHLHHPANPTIAAIKRMRRTGEFESVEPNYIRKALATPNDEFFPFQWHYPQINLPAAWDITTGDPSVIVAVIDTGVVLNHPDLQGQFVAGFDFISEPDNALDGDGIDSNPNDPGDQSLPGSRSTFHGTHVSGTIAAKTNNTIGVAGVAWDARIMPVRVLGRIGGLDTDIIQGIRYAAGLSNASGTLPAQRADIINMSLGGPGFSAAEQAAVSAARAAGVIVIVAAGNEQSDATFFSPGGLDGVVTVSAVGLTRELAPYSNFGSTVEVTAPGGDLSVDANADTLADGVMSTVGDDGGGLYAMSQGTSMAAPHVAGVAALMKAVNPGLTPSDFDQLLAGTHPGTSIAIVEDLGPPGKDTSFGFGLIDALGAVRAAGELVGAVAVDSPIIQVVPRNLDFGATSTTAAIDVTNGGVGALSVTSANVDQPWLSVTPSTGGAGTYTVSVDRSNLADGVFAGSIDFVSNGGNATVTVRLVVGSPATGGGNVGTIYVLLVDPTTFAPIAQDNISASDGYTFTLTNIPPGQYSLFGGTDMDDDTFVGNEGEVFGGYPTILDPTVLDATSDRTGLMFGTSHVINLQNPGATRVGDGRSTLRTKLRRMMTKERSANPDG